MCADFQTKRTFFYFFGPNLLKNWFLSWSLKTLSPDSVSPPSRYYFRQYSVKTDKLKFLGLYLEQLPNYKRYFGSNNAEGVAESWVEIKMS